MEVYINWKQNTFIQYIAMRPILELCEEVEQWTGLQVLKRWWEKEEINPSGAPVLTVMMEEETEGTDMVGTDD